MTTKPIAKTAKTLDRAAIHHIAKLASLSLSDAEADKLAHELGAIVGYVEQLNSLDTSNVDATASVRIGESRWREDVPQRGLSHDDALRAAPHVELDGFAVPTFVES